MDRKQLISKKNDILKMLKQERKSEPKRMKKTVPTIFITDDSKEEISLIKKRDVEMNNKKGRGFFIKVIRKSQIIMFASALCLVCVGYLAYNPLEKTEFISTTLDNSTLADIGDATFVSSQKLLEEIDRVKENENVETKEVKADIKLEDDYFINSKIDRDKMYSQMLESYQKILDNNSISSEQKAIAVQEISKINNQKNSIMIAENLIKTKGMEDVIIFVNLDSISVIVKSQELKKEQIAQIQNIVTRELCVEISNVHISTR